MASLRWKCCIDSYDWFNVKMVNFHSQVSRFPPDHLGHASSNTLGRAQVLLLLLEKVKVLMKSYYKTEKIDNEQELFTRSLFVELGEASETGKTQCCPIRCHNHKCKSR